MKTFKRPFNVITALRAKGEPLYFYDDYELSVVRFESGKIYIKNKGGNEFETTVMSNLAMNAFLEHFEISKEDYYGFY